MQHLNKLAITSVPALLLCSHQALAYIGPGMGAGTLGVLLGLIGSVFLAVFAFFWYPIKRLFAGKGKKEKTPAEATAEPKEQAEQANTREA
jgi:hypothetical protein